MNLKLNKIQKETLNLLIDIYEKSATYKGINAKNQSFVINPEKIFPNYNSDYADQDDVNQFNRDIKCLVDADLVEIKYVRGTPVIDKVILNINSLFTVYNVLGRADITQKRYREMEIYSEYMEKHKIINSFCKKQIGRLEMYKDAEYPIDISINILKLLDTVLNNSIDIMERELSVEILGDTKLFEKSYKTRICKIIEEHGQLEFDLDSLDEKEKKKVILEEFQVYSNPSYVFFKGDVEINYKDGAVIAVKQDNPIALSSDAINKIHTIKVNSKKIVTVENLTSYNRIKDDKSTFIYLSGYHNTAKQRFLKMISECNDSISWYHFGDIDPDGYYILKNLLEKTGIQFNPLFMSVKELQRYKKYCKQLEKNDIVKAESLIKMHFFDKVMDFMLENNCKLEQEIISWIDGREAEL